MREQWVIQKCQIPEIKQTYVNSHKNLMNYSYIVYDLFYCTGQDE